MAQHLAKEHEVELVIDLWRLSDDDLASVITTLKLRPVSADKLKEAVKAAQVYRFSVHFLFFPAILLKPSRLLGQASASTAQQG